MPESTRDEVDWWDRIGTMRWQHVVLSALAFVALVALFAAEPMRCSVSIKSTPNTTTTVLDG